MDKHHKELCTHSYGIRLSRAKKYRNEKYLKLIFSTVICCILSHNVYSSDNPYTAYDEQIVDINLYNKEENRAYTLDDRDNYFSYPRRWNPFRSGSCFGDSHSRGRLRVLFENERLIVTMGSHPFVFRNASFMGNNMNFLTWLVEAGCSGELILNSRSSPYCASLSGEKGFIELFFMALDSSKCDRFRYRATKQRACSGVLEKSTEDIYGNSIRIFKPSSGDNRFFRTRVVPVDEEKNPLNDGEIFDFSSKGGHGYITLKWSAEKSEFLGDLLDILKIKDRQPKTTKFNLDNPGFRCYEWPMVNDADKHIGSLGEVSTLPCDKQPGCKWINIPSNFKLSNWGLGLSEVNKLGGSLSDWEAIQIELRNDGTLEGKSSSKHFWKVIQGSRIRIRDLCVTSDDDGSNIKLEECDNAGENRFYVPVIVEFANRNYTTVEEFPYDVVIRPCISMGDNSTEIVNINTNPSPESVEKYICKLPRNYYQEAKHK
ncbi:hypothetical protein [Candidatus Ichthyocystis sparus]|nr:hypothetical protein [Candidatus Ichthyocystis sparus]